MVNIKFSGDVRDHEFLINLLKGTRNTNHNDHFYFVSILITTVDSCLIKHEELIYLHVILQEAIFTDNMKLCQKFLVHSLYSRDLITKRQTCGINKV